MNFEVKVDAYKVNSLIINEHVDPLNGRVIWDSYRSIFNASALLCSIIFAPLYFTWSAFLVFIVLLIVTMCAGHSIGFHRRLIHRTFHCEKWLERLLVWLGVLVGMHGPFWVIRSHDFRDWAQRQKNCHPYLRHGGGFIKDAWWSLHCKLVLDNPPEFNPGIDIGNDKFYIFLQKTWMMHQIPLAIILFFVGGLPWVVWGVVVRVMLGVHMHWMVGYFCHTNGSQDWLVDDGAVQAHNVWWAAIPSMGESWHNNHHAFPASARHGLYPGQLDIGYLCLLLLEKLGLVWNIQTPETLPPRPGITPISEQAKRTYLQLQKNISQDVYESSCS